ncbi:MAG: polysaccharide deacetylase family protein [Tepidanaerobacteraceae bacterium]|jgi:peptidoglycan/xylan/chitin deacetylase (PgdA/CDA1 family)
MQVQMKFERYIATLIIAVLFSMLAFPGKSSVGQTAVSKLPPLLHRDLHDYLVEQEIRQQVRLNILPQLSQSVMAARFLRHGPEGKKRVSITFDDGPFLFTEKYISVLKEYDVDAAFFLIGVQIDKYPDEAKKIAESGYEIGVHSYGHRQLTAMSRSSIENDFEKSLSAVKRITDSEIRFFRPPFGEFNDTVIDIAKKYNLTTVLWCVDPRDWQETDPDVIARHVIDRATNGAIILLHEGRESTIEALPQIIEGLWERGFEIVSLSELLSEEIV